MDLKFSGGSSLEDGTSRLSFEGSRPGGRFARVDLFFAAGHDSLSEPIEAHMTLAYGHLVESTPLRCVGTGFSL